METPAVTYIIALIFSKSRPLVKKSDFLPIAQTNPTLFGHFVVIWKKKTPPLGRFSDPRSDLCRK